MTQNIRYTLSIILAIHRAIRLYRENNKQYHEEFYKIQKDIQRLEITHRAIDEGKGYLYKNIKKTGTKILDKNVFDIINDFIIRQPKAELKNL